MGSDWSRSRRPGPAQCGAAPLCCTARARALARTHAAPWVWAAGEGEAKQEDMTYFRRTLKNKSVQGSFLERQCWLVCVVLRPFSLILLHSEYVL